MSLSVKHIASFLTLAVTCFVTACKDPQVIGLPDQPLGVFVTDTITVRTSTVYVDSVRTSLSSYMLVGQYKDPNFGTVSSSSFGQLFYYSGDTTALSFGDSPVLDSVVLFLNYDYSYGDTLSSQSITVHELRESIPSTFYNTRTTVNFSYNPIPLGTKEFQPRPLDTNRPDTLKIRLDNAVGNTLLSYAGQAESSFLKSFYGIALVTASDSKSVIGYYSSITSGTKLRLYYKTGGTARVHDFQIGSRLNRIQRDWKGTPLNAMMNDSLPASRNNNLSYLQGGTGLMTRVEFPYLKKFAESGNVAINRAELVVQPVAGTVGSNLNPPFQLGLYDVNTSNQIARENITGNRYYVPLLENYGSTPQLAGLSAGGTYSFLLKQYISQVIEGKRANNGVMLAVPSFSTNYFLRDILGVSLSSPIIASSISNESTLNQLILNSQQGANQTIKLRVHYTHVKAN